jgi:hypothetical protein
MTRAPTQFRPSISPMSPAIAIVLSGVAWFLAVSWLNFVGEHGLNLFATITSGVLVMLFTLVLLVAPRFRLHRGRRAPCRVDVCYDL